MRHSLQGVCDRHLIYICLMVNVSILVLRNAVLASIADSNHVFAMVNEFLKKSGRQPVFNVQLVGLSKEVKLNNGLFSIQPDIVMGDVEHVDLIIIPSMTGDMMSSTYLNKDYAPWIAQKYKNGAEVARLCVGALLLAYSGILKGRECTTHWMYANEFRHFYPSVTVVEERVITAQNGLYSSGGNNAYWNLLLFLVEKYTDRQIAIHTAKYFVIDIDRHRQSPFVVFNGLKDHDDDTIKNAQEYIEQHYHDKFTV